MPNRSGVWLIAQGQNQIEIAAAYLNDGEVDAAEEACQKADECRGEAAGLPLHELDTTVCQTLHALNIDIRTTKARIRGTETAKARAAT